MDTGFPSLGRLQLTTQISAVQECLGCAEKPAHTTAMAELLCAMQNLFIAAGFQQVHIAPWTSQLSVVWAAVPYLFGYVGSNSRGLKHFYWEVSLKCKLRGICLFFPSALYVKMQFFSSLEVSKFMCIGRTNQAFSIICRKILYKYGTHFIEETKQKSTACWQGKCILSILLSLLLHPLMHEKLQQLKLVQIFFMGSRISKTWKQNFCAWSSWRSCDLNMTFSSLNVEGGEK